MGSRSQVCDGVRGCRNGAAGRGPGVAIVRGVLHRISCGDVVRGPGKGGRFGRDFHNRQVLRFHTRGSLLQYHVIKIDRIVTVDVEILQCHIATVAGILGQEHLMLFEGGGQSVLHRVHRLKGCGVFRVGHHTHYHIGLDIARIHREYHPQVAHRECAEVGLRQHSYVVGGRRGEEIERIVAGNSIVAIDVGISSIVVAMDSPTFGIIADAGGITVEVLRIGQGHLIAQGLGWHAHPVAHITAAAIGAHVCRIGGVGGQAWEGVGCGGSRVHRSSGGIRHVGGGAADIEVPGALIAAGCPRHRNIGNRCISKRKTVNFHTSGDIHLYIIQIDIVCAAADQALQCHIPTITAIVGQVHLMLFIV